MTSINCLANKFGDDELATLLTAIEGTSVRSLCGLTEGQTTADFSRQNLGPIDVKIMAAEYGFQGFIAALNSVVLDLNPLFGKIWPNENHKNGGEEGVHDTAHAIFDALASTSITSLLSLIHI